MKKDRTEREYRDLIGKAVFWLVRWPNGPESQPKLPEDLAKLMEVVDEDIEDSMQKLIGALRERAKERGR